MFPWNETRIKCDPAMDGFFDQFLKGPAAASGAPSESATPMAIRQRLLEDLRSVGPFDSCVLLDYPLFFNIGDHLIWLSLLAWVIEDLGAEVRYVSSPATFSEKEFEKRAGQSPIIFTGGGNLGDLWVDHQQFREKIIARYHDRPIIIMPQSIFFKDPANLKRACEIFNAHPNLTLFTRDDVSYAIAKKYFHNVRVVKTPDIAFYLADRLKSMASEQSSRVLIHHRDDRELPCASDFKQRWKSEGVVFEDWCSINRFSRTCQKFLRKIPFLAFLWRSPSLGRMLRRVPPAAQKELVRLFLRLEALPQAAIHLRSLDLVVQGIEQMNQYRLVISNRLHGHILCTLLGKHNVLLPNSYHKNQAFYSTWTHGISYTSFAPEFSLPALVERSHRWKNPWSHSRSRLRPAVPEGPFPEASVGSNAAPPRLKSASGEVTHG